MTSTPARTVTNAAPTSNGVPARVLLADGAIDLRLGDHRTVLADVKKCDVIITSPPFSARTHEGQRTGSSIRMPTIGYDFITEDDAVEIADLWAPRVTSWAVIFCDHVAFNWHARAWDASKWLAFAPVLVKRNPTPRFSGDGPAFALEFIHAARRRSAAIKPGSLPAYYEVNVGSTKDDRIVAGSFTLDLARALVRDYTKPGDLVVDPFCGGGTTALACAMEGRRCITSEVDPATFAKARARLERGYTPDMFATTEGTK